MAAVWTYPDVIIVVVALGFLGVCEVGKIAMEASRRCSGVDQPRQNRLPRGNYPVTRVIANLAQQPTKNTRARRRIRLVNLKGHIDFLEGSL